MISKIIFAFLLLVLVTNALQMRENQHLSGQEEESSHNESFEEVTHLAGYTCNSQNNCRVDADCKAQSGGSCRNIKGGRWGKYIPQCCYPY